MQEAELNDALSRMRLQLLKEGHFSQVPTQQRDSQGIQQQQGHWGGGLQIPSSGTNGWLSDTGAMSQPVAPGARTLPTQPAVGSPQSWSGAAASPVTAAGSTPEGMDQAAALWGGGLFASDPQKIWSGGSCREPSCRPSYPNLCLSLCSESCMRCAVGITLDRAMQDSRT